MQCLEPPQKINNKIVAYIDLIETKLTQHSKMNYTSTRASYKNVFQFIVTPYLKKYELTEYNIHNMFYFLTRLHNVLQ